MREPVRDTDPPGDYDRRMKDAEVDVDQLESLLVDGARLVDVREHDEYTTAHIGGAQLIPLATVPDNYEALRHEKPIFVICAKGGRSARAVEFLRLHDVDAVNVIGGMSAWLDAAKPVVDGPGPG